MKLRVTLAALVLLLSACGGGEEGGNTVKLKQPEVKYDPPLTGSSLMPAVDSAAWDETAVRKVLHTFAFGGFASDAQIRAWADMAPQAAIVEMLTFDSYNPKLSPTADSDPLNGTDRSLRALSALWSGASSPLPPSRRASYKIGDWRGLHNTALLAAGVPGINPVPHRVVQWEINYHLVANLDADVTAQQLANYYETIQKSLAAREPYQNTLAAAASSVAIARQYKHYRNFYDAKKNVFTGNEDFAREYHQLFFGILGTEAANDIKDDYHEVVTIKNTAKLLTDMTLVKDTDNELTFGTARHHVAPLEILHQPIAGANAKEKIYALAQFAIRYPESERNLPVMIVRGLASDKLSDADLAELRAVWAGMGANKDLLTFLRTYAISRQFHGAGRVKYWTAQERNLLHANLLSLNQTEIYADFYAPAWRTYDDAFVPFEPEHNVFGHTTGEETAQSGERFLAHFNRSPEEMWRYSKAVDTVYPTWAKDWGTLAPKTGDSYRVDAVAEWLWQRFLADGLKNMGALERLHLHALLGTGLDPAVACAANRTSPPYDKVYSATEAESDPQAIACRTTLGAATLDLGSTDAKKRKTANERVGLAVGFIVALPYALMQEGR